MFGLSAEALSVWGEDLGQLPVAAHSCWINDGDGSHWRALQLNLLRPSSNIVVLLQVC